MGYHEHKQHDVTSVKCALLIISDSRTIENDKSGTYIKDRLAASHHSVISYKIIPNDASAILEAVNNILNEVDVDVIITSGGTGISHRDVTVDTLIPICEKHIEGFGELFRQLSYKQIGAGSIMSRATAGLSKGKIIICLPGSLSAVTLAIDKVLLPEIGHLVREAKR